MLGQDLVALVEEVGQERQRKAVAKIRSQRYTKSLRAKMVMPRYVKMKFSDMNDASCIHACTTAARHGQSTDARADARRRQGWGRQGARAHATVAYAEDALGRHLRLGGQGGVGLMRHGDTGKEHRHDAWRAQTVG